MNKALEMYKLANAYQRALAEKDNDSAVRAWEGMRAVALSTCRADGINARKVAKHYGTVGRPHC